MSTKTNKIEILHTKYFQRAKKNYIPTKKDTNVKKEKKEEKISKEYIRKPSSSRPWTFLLLTFFFLTVLYVIVATASSPKLKNYTIFTIKTSTSWLKTSETDIQHITPPSLLPPLPLHTHPWVSYSSAVLTYNATTPTWGSVWLRRTRGGSTVSRNGYLHCSVRLSSNGAHLPTSEESRS